MITTQTIYFTMVHAQNVARLQDLCGFLHAALRGRQADSENHRLA